jgi:SMC interacting uncharacterized protein involved in chromosome segregation
MPTVVERVSVVEVQVANLDERFDELKDDVRDMGVSISSRLDHMYDASCTQHAELGRRLQESQDTLNNTLATNKQELTTKIENLEKIKNKWTMYVMLLLAFGAGTGWMGHLDIKTIIKFLGL